MRFLSLDIGSALEDDRHEGLADGVLPSLCLLQAVPAMLVVAAIAGGATFSNKVSGFGRNDFKTVRVGA